MLILAHNTYDSELATESRVCVTWGGGGREKRGFEQVPWGSRLSFNAIGNLRQSTTEGEGANLCPGADPAVARHRPICIDQHHTAFCHLQAGNADVWPACTRISGIAILLSFGSLAILCKLLGNVFVYTHLLPFMWLSAASILQGNAGACYRMHWVGKLKLQVFHAPG